MILCNLAVLLAERNLTITKVSKDTGISRTTLTALSRNYGQGIQFDTLNSLCNYLKITSSGLLSFFPFDVKIYGCSVDLENLETSFNFDFTYKNKKTQYEIMGKLNFINAHNFLDSVQIDLFLPEDDDNTHEYLRNILNEMPIKFLKEIESDLINPFAESLEYALELLDNEPGRLANEFEIYFTWDI